jgi:tight adherence protein B
VNELWTIYIIVFCAVLLAVQGAYWVYNEQKTTRDAINRRLVLTAQKGNAREVLEALRRERGLLGIDDRYFGRFSDVLVQTGLKLDGKTLVVAGFLLGVLFFVVLGFGLGYGLISLMLAIVFAAGSMMIFLAVVRRRRIARFSEQLPDSIDVIVRGVKSGYPFNVALGLVAKEMTDPIGTEFGITSDEINFGSDTGTALDNLYRRVGQDDLIFLIMAIRIQSETGGNLAEILTRLSRLIRERTMLRLKVKALSAEGRLSAVFLTAMPFILFGVVSLLRPDYYSGVSDNPIIMPALILAIIMLIVGNLTIYRMVNFKV